MKAVFLTCLDFHAVLSKMSLPTAESAKCEISETQRKLPKAVPFILINIFFERFCSGGILGIF